MPPWHWEEARPQEACGKQPLTPAEARAPYARESGSETEAWWAPRPAGLGAVWLTVWLLSRARRPGTSRHVCPPLVAAAACLLSCPGSCPAEGSGRPCSLLALGAPQGRGHLPLVSAPPALSQGHQGADQMCVCCGVCPELVDDTWPVCPAESAE